jgi:ATP-binding cassette subfamily E protein 1
MYCPRVRTGDKTIIITEKGKPLISEELCVGCGICIHRCPFDAIRIVGLPEELSKDLLHQFGPNGFRLFRLPTPVEGKVIGLIGQNGIGKTTAIQILSGEVIPNLGELDVKPAWDWVLDKFAGSMLYEHFEKIANREIRTALKPQYVDKIPKVAKGKVFDLLGKVNEFPTDILDYVVSELELKSVLARDITQLSGGELQRVAIAATMLKDVDIYFFDEPSSYLDIHQRLKVAKLIHKLVAKKFVVIIEHDLAVMDFLADNVHMLYGEEGAYGVVAHPRPVRSGINTYLSGFLREENIRFRDKEIKFEPRPPRTRWRAGSLLEYNALEKRYNGFSLRTSPGVIHQGEVVGVVGPNATGKTTFVKMLAKIEKPTTGRIDVGLRVSYKPQYIKVDFDGTVEELYYSKLGDAFRSDFYLSEIERKLNLKPLYNRHLETLAGGELQRVTIALALVRDADIYLIDEPSAYLDSNQRMEVAKTIRRVMENRAKSAMIVDHDMYFIDLVSDSIMVFSGEPARYGYAEGPFDMRTGMNKFLHQVGVTFRRDNLTFRPRINKPDSLLDRRQKASGEYYYST